MMVTMGTSVTLVTIITFVTHGNNLVTTLGTKK